MGTWSWLQRNRAQARLAVRMVAACIITYLLGLVLGLHQNHWAVLTAIIVMQSSVGGSLKAMLDRIVGSLGGAISGVIISVGLHRLGISSPGMALVIGLPPLSLLAALKPAYRVTPITFIILILTPDLQALGPVDSAFERMLEIAVGSVIALAVSLAILPARAHEALAHAVSQALSAMADLMAALPGGIIGKPDSKAIELAHGRIRNAIGRAETAADEALRERASFLTDAVDPLPICRTLRRLRHDMAIFGRTITTPLPEPVAQIMLQPLVVAASEISIFLMTCANAIARRKAPPSVAELESIFKNQSHAVATIRQQGAARDLPDDDLGRIFGLGFALEQLRRDLDDLWQRGAELAR